VAEARKAEKFSANQVHNMLFRGIFPPFRPGGIGRGELFGTLRVVIQAKGNNPSLKSLPLIRTASGVHHNTSPNCDTAAISPLQAPAMIGLS